MKFEIPDEVIIEAIRIEGELQLEIGASGFSPLANVLSMRLDTLGTKQFEKAIIQFKMEKGVSDEQDTLSKSI
jgi:hypothetical protein